MTILQSLIPLGKQRLQSPDFNEQGLSDLGSELDIVRSMSGVSRSSRLSVRVGRVDEEVGGVPVGRSVGGEGGGGEDVGGGRGRGGEVEGRG